MVDISVREILDLFSEDHEVMKAVLEAKAEEDKRRTAEETLKAESIKWHNKTIELELVREQARYGKSLSASLTSPSSLFPSLQSDQQMSPIGGPSFMSAYLSAMAFHPTTSSTTDSHVSAPSRRSTTGKSTSDGSSPPSSPTSLPPFSYTHMTEPMDYDDEVEGTPTTLLATDMEATALDDKDESLYEHISDAPKRGHKKSTSTLSINTRRKRSRSNTHFETDGIVSRPNRDTKDMSHAQVMSVLKARLLRGSPSTAVSYSPIHETYPYHTGHHRSASQSSVQKP
ncbi:hypothetical protein BZG36_03726 [Bifiguratus adelaidae]|uniref:Uncharacterized protein n=1 Tax=Bifiguratus adelaidae TaxID=1938954 RepID=A0A261XZ59_9FUNG|nr:hypothetical protein BZG36_03726 [Bifiguratus adelaidae]